MCSRYGHKEIKGLDWDKTMQCVQDSFTTPDESQWNSPTVNNTMIDRDIEYWAKYGTALYPAIVINNYTYRGQIETQAVYNAICAAFHDPPKEC